MFVLDAHQNAFSGNGNELIYNDAIQQKEMK